MAFVVNITTAAGTRRSLREADWVASAPAIPIAPNTTATARRSPSG